MPSNSESDLLRSPSVEIPISCNACKVYGLTPLGRVPALKASNLSDAVCRSSASASKERAAFSTQTKRTLVLAFKENHPDTYGLANI